MRRRCAGALVILLIAVSACSRMRIGADWDTTVDFSGFDSYAWLPEPERGGESPHADSTLLAARVHRAVDAVMAEQGHEKVDASDADFLVTYHAALDTKLDVQTIDTGYHYRIGSWGWSAGAETYVRYYDEGSLVLDVVDPETKQLVWRGWATAKVDPSATPEEREARVNEAVRRILARFPPPPPGD